MRVYGVCVWHVRVACGMCLCVGANKTTERITDEKKATLEIL